MLAIAILGIGVISIAALFPAGIAQQRLSVDDSLGSIVADNAFGLIRSCVRQSQFGTIEGFDPTYVSPTVPGDWPWSRPAFYFSNKTLNIPGLPSPINVPAGSISIFGRTTSPQNADTNTEIPWNGNDSSVPPSPPIIITQRERYYPMAPMGTSTETAKPQYVWDCMFRRFQGRILVAIFVYRVTLPGGSSVAYTVPPQPTPNEVVPQIPLSLNLVADTSGGSPPVYNSCGAWSTGNFPGGGGADNDPATVPLNIVRGTQDGTPYNPGDLRQCWQEPRQWLLDQNNNIHRVIGQSRTSYTASTDDVLVELSRAPSQVLGVNDMTQGGIISTQSVHFYLGAPRAFPSPSPVDDRVVTNIWYIPTEVMLDVDLDGNPETAATLTPVFATVKEL